MLRHFENRNTASKHWVLIVVSAVVFALGMSGGASAYTQQTLHSFCSGNNCSDGFPPNGLLQDMAGNLYGTTENAGKNGKGVVYKVVPSADGSKYTDHIIYNFCARANCPGGAMPVSDLIMDTNGRLYGTASSGGRFGAGVIFRLTQGAKGWTYAVLHSFCRNGEPACTDGATPSSGLSYQGQASGSLWNGSSPLFGVAFLGGSNDNGVAYEFMTNGNSWTYKVIHTFKTSGQPQPVLVDSRGNVFGATGTGGAYGGGLLYRLAAGTWKEATLHNFCEFDACSDGTGPWGKLVMDAAGDIFGVTPMGGSFVNCPDQQGCGLVFERPAGGGYELFHAFCTQANCTDGANPYGGLTMDGAGNLFGTTFNGGAASNSGVVFRLDADGDETILYTFCPNGDSCADGKAPANVLLLDGQGDLFGTTNFGGANGDYGTVFVLKP